MSDTYSILHTQLFIMSGCVRRPVHCYNASYPTLSIGYTEIPAPLLPIGIALLYITWLLSGRPSGPQWSQSGPVTEKRGLEKSGIVRDEENLAVNERPRRRLRLGDFALRVIHHSYTVSSLATGGRREGRPLKETCLVQVAYIFAESFYYNQSISADDISLAVGWLLLLVRAVAAITEPIVNNGFTVVILMTTIAYTTLQSSSKTEPRELNTIAIASLLLVLIGRPYLEMDSWPAPFNLESSTLSPWVLLLSLFVSSMRRIARSWKTTNGLSLSIMDRFRALAVDAIPSNTGIISEILDLLLFCGVLFGAIAPVSFLFSCLPFRRLTLGLPCKPPVVVGPSLLVGTFVYMPIVLLWMHLASFGEIPLKERNLYGHRICIESVALAVVTMVAVAGSLEAYEFVSRTVLAA